MEYFVCCPVVFSFFSFFCFVLFVVFFLRKFYNLFFITEVSSKSTSAGRQCLDQRRSKLIEFFPFSVK